MIKKNRQQRRKVRPKKKMPLPQQSRKQLSQTSSTIAIACCMLTNNDIFGKQSREDVEKYFARYNENMTAFNSGTNKQKMLELINVIKAEFYGLDIRGFYE